MKKAKMVVGCQLGDEGKGKVVDYLAQNMDLVVRCMGGNNAGHTVVLNDGRAIALHLLPSAVKWPDIKLGIGAGVVLDPLALINEVLYVKDHGIEVVPRLAIDMRTSLVMVYHRVLDLAKELVRSRGGGKAIGTTARGIGPAYVDIADRVALHFCDLLHPDSLAAKISNRLSAAEDQIKAMGITEDEWQAIFDSLTEKEQHANALILNKGLVTAANLDYVRFRAPSGIAFNQPAVIAAYITAAAELESWHCANDLSELICAYLYDDKDVLIEAAQGAFLDVLHGTYPFVTSSYTIAGGGCVGLGIGPGMIGEVRGVSKAYCTRVGGGPFPTKMADELAKVIRGKQGQVDAEFGASTGRERGVGWLDIPMLARACQLSGVDKLTITKLDKFSGVGTIKIAVAWVSGEVWEKIPADYTLQSDALSVRYVEVPGWDDDISACRKFDQLPPAAQNFVRTVQSLLNDRLYKRVVIDQIGVGPEADAIIQF